jgi:heme o synthase
VTSTASAHAHAAVVGRQFANVIGAYVALTKPRIIELLLVTTVPAMILAQRGLPPSGLLVTTLVGGTLAAGSANALNCYLDRDIDAIMHRTARRPLSRSVVTPTSALVFGLILGTISVVEFWTTANHLSAVLAFVAIAFYVLVYTALLKRRTSSNIVWGGAAGCMPVLIGWSAVTDSLAWAPFVMFAIVFLWTPPHFWALAMKYRDDYAAVNVPMLPVVASAAFVADRILLYTGAMVVASLALGPVGHLHIAYLPCAAVLGGVFLYEAYRMRSRVIAEVDPRPMRLFQWSITYLSLLFLAVAVTAVW